MLTGIAYPVVMWGVAQVAFHNTANGSLVSYHGRVVGSSLLCQEFVDAKGNPLPLYFKARPSSAVKTDASPAAIRALVSQYTQGRTLGFFGQPRVDVLTLNIALDEKYPLQG